MKRWFTTFAALLFCSAALRADVTIVQTMTMEGGMAAMAQAAGQNMSPKVTMRVKGTKMRSDVEMGTITMATIVDLAAKELTVINDAQKSATVKSMAAPAAGGATPPPSVTGPTVDGSVKATGKSQTIDGVKLDEYSFTTSMDMASMSGAQMPPEAAAAMQGLKMNMTGSIWVAKEMQGATEYLAFQKAAASSDMAGAAMGASGVSIPGMDKLMKAMGAVSGLAYLTDMNMTIDGTGQLAEMMKQMGAMKITVKVNSVTTDAIADDQFKVPAGYTITKQ